MGERVTSSNPDVYSAQKLYEKDKANWSLVYEAARDDLEFYKGGKDQWESDDLRIRSITKRPTLTTNMLPQFVHQVVNDIRMNVPTQKVLPVDDNADLETAKTIQGLLKNIEYTSNAPVVYDTAADNQVKCGIGFIRIDHDYMNVESFDDLQQILLKRVVNPLSCIIDSSSIECDGSDAKHAFVLDTYSKSEFEEKWPKKEPVSFDSISGTSDEQIVVAEFFKIVETEVEIGLMPDGKTVLEVSKAQELGLKPIKTKKVKRNKVRRQKISGMDILEEGWFPGSYIPIVPVYGEEHWIDGKRHLFSLIRHAKDPQRMVNYWSSLETELLQKSPQAPFMGVEGQFEGHEDDWTNPGVKMVLQYKQTDVNGVPAPQPIRIPPPPIPTGVINARQSAIQDMRDAMGIQQAGLGMRSNETSGVAISARVKEGDVSNMHFGDNLNRSIAHCGRIEMSMLPEVYDTQRIIRILDEEDQPKSVGINGLMADGQERVFDMNVGKYDVAVVAGPSFTTRRQETQQMMTQVLQAAPQLIQVMGDLMFKYSDVPGADVISERLKKTIPPQLLSDDKDQQQIPPQVQQQMAQMHNVIVKGQAAIQELQAQLQQCEQQLKSKESETQLKQADLQIKAQDSASKAQIDQINLAIKKEELEIKKMELAIKQQEVEIEAFRAHAEAVRPEPEPANPAQLSA